MSHSYGWRRDRLDPRDAIKAPARATIAQLPESFSLAAEMPPIWNQGQYGSCTAEGSCAIYAHQLAVEGKPAVQPSILFQYYNERLIEGDVNADAGAEPRDAFKALAQYGALPDSSFPYTVPLTQAPTADDYTFAKAHRITGYATVAQAETDLKTSIIERHPVGFGFVVYPQLESDECASTGVATLPDTATEQPLGGHFVVLIGWDDARDAFLCRNSWGADWGVHGNFWMPYAYVLSAQLAADFWTITQES